MSPDNAIVRRVSQALLEVCQSTPAVNLAPIHAAQLRVQRLLAANNGTPELARLVKSDLVETLLLRAAHVISEAPGHTNPSHKSGRDGFLTLHLEMVLATWIGARAQTLADTVAVERTIRSIERITP